MTLVEVMVALAVLAIALVAVVQSVAHSTHTIGGLRDRTLAAWLADNIIVELQVSGAWEIGTETDTREFARRTWPYSVTIQETQFEAVRRVDVTVFAPQSPEDTVISMRALLTNPALVTR
jgi:general secretion pathway protein I